MAKYGILCIPFNSFLYWNEKIKHLPYSLWEVCHQEGSNKHSFTVATFSSYNEAKKWLRRVESETIYWDPPLGGFEGVSFERNEECFEIVELNHE